MRGTPETGSAEVARRCADAMYASDAASQKLGITVEVSEAGEARAWMQVTPAMVNGHGVCHGGYIFTLADSAFAFACNGYGVVTVAASAAIEFLRPASPGDRLLAEASERYRGRNTGIYDVAVSNQDGQLVATFRGRSHATSEPVIPGLSGPGDAEK